MEIYIAIGIVAAVIITLTLVVINQHKKIATLKKVVKESFSTLEVFLEKRLEIISSIITMCPPDSRKNKEISHLLSLITALQQNIESPKRFSLESSIDNAYKTAILELSKINEKSAKFQKLLNNYKSVQADIISSKNYYNNNVEAYNKKVTKAPSSIIANMFGFKKEFYVK